MKLLLRLLWSTPGEHALLLGHSLRPWFVSLPQRLGGGDSLGLRFNRSRRFLGVGRRKVTSPAGDCSLEVPIIERVILDLDREPLVMGVERWPAGHSPRDRRRGALALCRPACRVASSCARSFTSSWRYRNAVWYLPETPHQFPAPTLRLVSKHDRSMLENQL
jgi:hypothetical protein